VARDYVDTLSMNGTMLLKRATVADTLRNLQSDLLIPHTVAEYSELIDSTIGAPLKMMLLDCP
jgi:hypothetical protein